MPAKKRANGRSLAMLALVLILVGTNIGTLYYFLVYRQAVPAEDVPMEIADLTESPEDYIGRTLTVAGHPVLSAGQYPLLVENPLSFLNNSLDSSNYLFINGTPPDSLYEYAGMRCLVKGTIEWSDQDDGLLGIRYLSHKAVGTEPVVQGSFVDRVVSPNKLVEDQPDFPEPVPQKYAVLYSGGINPKKAYTRYWNDLVWMYYILLSYGYPNDHIYVIYKNGTPESHYMPVHYPATHDSLATVFGILNETMTFRDTLFFFTTNHGGGSGISVWTPMDHSGALTHTQVANWLDMVPCDHMIVVMEQCYAGKFIPYISADRRVILTACSVESSYGCDTEGQWDEFVYHFMSAMIGWHLNDYTNPVDADYNDNGLVSLREAFIHAAFQDSWPETPLYCDDDSGVGHPVSDVLSLPVGYGGTITL